MKTRARWVLAALLGLLRLEHGRAEQGEPPIQDRIPHFEVEVTKLRGLQFPKPVKAAVISKEDFRAVLIKELDRDLPSEKAGRYARGLAKFGLIPKDLDLREALVHLIADATAAFYDPDTKELKVLASGAGQTPAELDALKKAGIDLDGAVLVHELTHAAQDQAYDLSTLPLDSGDNDDLSLALHSVVEGDASAVGWKYAFKERFDAIIGLIDQGYKTGELPSDAGKLPAYLRQTLTFPYGYGTDFVLSYVRTRGGPWSPFPNCGKICPSRPSKSFTLRSISGSGIIPSVSRCRISRSFWGPNGKKPAGMFTASSRSG